MDAGDLFGLPLLSELSRDQLSELALLTERLELGAGELLFRRGDPSDCLFILEAGRLALFTEVGVSELEIAVLEAPAVLGGLGVFERQPRSLSARACDPAVLLRVPADVLMSLQDRGGPHVTSLYRTLFFASAQRLRAMNDAVASHWLSRSEGEARRQLEDEFRQLLVHDLRSPIALCEAGLSQVIEKQAKYGKLNPRQDRILKRARRSARFLKRLVSEILEVGRSYSSDARIEETTLRAALVEAVPQALGGVRGPDLSEAGDISTFEALANVLRPHEIHLEAPASTLNAPLFVDRIWFLQVLMNLISNALKYAPGWLAIRGQDADGLLSVSVVDRGPGIPETKRRQVFDYFGQANAKDEGVQRGYGLGLAGAARLVEAMGGTIEARSGDGGRGTAITVDIPRRPS